MKPKSAEEKYPEHEAVAQRLFIDTIRKINYEAGRVKDKSATYNAQCILEMLIKKLDSAV